jgi:hypothetical protein
MADDTTEPKPRRKAGRPPIEFDLKLVEAMGKIGATAEEMAYVLPASLRTIRDRMADHESDFCMAYQQGYSQLRMSLRRKQVAMALDGDRTMLIWLGKQLLGQRDRLQQESSVRVELEDAGSLDQWDVARAREYFERTRLPS